LSKSDPVIREILGPSYSDAVNDQFRELSMHA
jgi:hypothetical protein